MNESAVDQLQVQIGHQFKNIGLLREALTHRSYLNENPSWSSAHNERLEFLGDAVLELVVTEYLFTHYPNPEGEMTSWRAALVNAMILSQIAADLAIGDALVLSKGEAKDTGRARQYILANAIEAVIGALYLDGGYAVAKVFIESHILSHLPQILENRLYRDAKSLFQEEAQERVSITPVYQVLEEWGPDHARQFRVGVFLGTDCVGQGEGPSKQDAQQEAARDALTKKGWQ